MTVADLTAHRAKTGATTLTRQFKMGATVLPDPDPTAPVEKIIEMYAPAYPHLRNATIGEPVREGDVLVYPLTKPAVQTKGGAGVESILSELDQWAANPNTPDANLQRRWEPVHQFLAAHVLQRPEPLNDPFLLPLA